MTQSALSRLEAGGVVPTIPVLERIALALGAELVVAFGRSRSLNRGQALAGGLQDIKVAAASRRYLLTPSAG